MTQQQRSYFLEVESGRVDPEARRIAEAAARRVCVDLGLAPVQVRFFREATKGEINGLALRGALADYLHAECRGGRLNGAYRAEDEGSCIWLSVSLRGSQVAKTTAHELRHVWQHKNWPYYRGASGTEYAEGDARDYVTRFFSSHATRSWWLDLLKQTF